MWCFAAKESAFKGYSFALMENMPPISEDLFWTLILACPKNGTILELGSGATTAMLAQHRTVYSIEDNPGYLYKYNKKEQYIYAPCDGDGFYSVSGLRVLPRYDVLFVDGPAHDNRIDRFAERLQYFDTRAHWFFDDTAHGAFADGFRRVEQLRGKTMIRFEKCYKEYGVIMGD